MEIAVISDLHLGPRGLADGFGHDDAEFLKFLDHLERNFERIVLLGDIWETLAGRFPGDQGEELKRARASHAEIDARFRREKYTYVHGNHDLVAGAVEATPDELVIHADGVRVLFTHGHQSDPLVERRRLLSELGVWLGGWIRRLGLKSLYRLFARIDAIRAGHQSDAAQCPFQRWAIHVAASRQADVMVTGHTHLATRAEHGAQLFLNSGSCSEGQLSFLSIDTRRGEYRVNTSI